MAGKGLTADERSELLGPLAGAVMLRRIFPLLGGLARCGTQRDAAGNRQLFDSQYAALILVGFFNPVLKSARALIAASGLKKIRQVTGGQKVSAGAFSEASSVFDPTLLEGLLQELRRQFQQHRFRLSRSLPAEQVVLIYECRWQVELFFRFLKQVLGCKQLLSAKTRGVEIQLSCALLASLLLALATGGNLTRRNYEMVCLSMSGWADDDEFIAALAQPP